MISILLPPPPPECSPNARCGWRAKAAAVQQYRYDCKMLALSQLPRVNLSVPRNLPVIVDIIFVLKDRRRHDWDNLLSSCKALIDGALVDTGLLPDDDVRSWTPTLRYEQGEKAGVRVELG